MESVSAFGQRCATYVWYLNLIDVRMGICVYYGIAA